MPGTFEQGVLYVSKKYKTATHLCCCGCGNRVVTPLKAGGWQLTMKNGSPTLFPSIGSFALPCESHYYIRAGRVDWAPKWSKAEVEAGWRADQRAREEGFSRQPGLWKRLRKLLGL